jgi:hypothetical protein
MTPSIAPVFPASLGSDYGLLSCRPSTEVWNDAAIGVTRQGKAAAGAPVGTDRNTDSFVVSIAYRVIAYVAGMPAASSLR